MKLQLAEILKMSLHPVKRSIELDIADFYDVLSSIGIPVYTTAVAQFSAQYVLEPAEYSDGVLAVQANIRYYDAKLDELIIDNKSLDFTPIQASVLEVALEDEIVAQIEHLEGV